MNDEKPHPHTLYGIEGKAYTRGAWEVDDDTYDQIGAAIEILGEHGPGLGRPLVDSIVGSRHKNMKDSGRDRLVGAKCGSCSPSTPSVGRSCCSPATSRGMDEVVPQERARR